MKFIRLFISLTLGLVAFAAGRGAENLVRCEWRVDGVAREALLFVPPAAKTVATPVIFAFHGHGGTMRIAARQYGYHMLWPEAIVVYMQGIKTPGRLTDPNGYRPGWQHSSGAQGDCDLKFFDAVLANLRVDYRVDDRRIFAAGHSNGGSFTYLLWAVRGDQFAAFAPSGATIAASDRSKLRPKPVLHVAGENDELVKFEWQQLMVAALRALNGCGEGRTWKEIRGCILYESKQGAPVVTFIHPGTHAFPREAPGLIVRFFKDYAKL